MFEKLIFSIAVTIAKLPFKILYRVSSFVYVIFLLIGYRKCVIDKNLLIVFPNKSQKERVKIRKQFYKNFSEYLLESLKSLTVEPSLINETHTKLFGLEEFNKVKSEEKKEIFILMPHIFNWDWIGFWAKKCSQKNIFAINKPLKSKFLDKKMDEARFRIGGMGLKTSEAFKKILSETQNPDNVYLFLVDQSPRLSKVKLSIPFFNKKTPVFEGYDVLIRKRKAAVFYCDIIKIKQGEYHYIFNRIEPDNIEFKPKEVIYKFFSLLEKSIIRNPSNWLWSHKRWKLDNEYEK